MLTDVRLIDAAEAGDLGHHPWYLMAGREREIDNRSTKSLSANSKNPLQPFDSKRLY
jgi:hypothetical protein